MFLNNRMTVVFLMLSITVYTQQKKGVEKDTIKVNELDEVVITATRTLRQLSSVPMPVTIISKKQLKRSGSVRLRDILLEQTGIVLVQDVGNSEGVQMQGIAADYTLIMIDGVPIVGRTAGNIDLNRITVNNIKQIEIVKGPSSSLYGSEALGGVINIITEQPKRDRFDGQFHVFTRGGARNELDVNSAITWMGERFGVVGGVNLNSSGGFDLSPQTNSKTTYPHQNFTGNLQLNYDFSDKLKGVFSQRYYRQTQQATSGDNTQTDWNFNGKISHQLSHTWSLDYTFYGTRFKTESIFNGSTSLFNRSLFRPEVRTKIDFSNSNIIAGVGANFDALSRSAFEGTKTLTAPYVFAQYDFNPLERLNVIIGARFENSNKYKSAFNPKISTSYKFNDWITAKASVGWGFKAPDFRQLYFNFRNTSNGYIVLGTQTLHELYGNVTGVQRIEKELRPETSIGYNVGFLVRPVDGLNININAFRNDIKDLIDTYDTQLNPINLGLPANTRTFTYRNIAKVYTQGVELDVNYAITRNIQFLVGYQFLDTGDKEQEQRIKDGQIFIRKTPSSRSEQLHISDYYGLPNRSKHTFNAKLFYENFEHQFSTNLRAIFRSKYALFDTNNSQGIIDAYDNFVSENLQVNFSIEKTFLEMMNIQIGIDNLFNERGQENSTLFRNNDNVLRLGRTYYGKVQFNF